MKKMAVEDKNMTFTSSSIQPFQGAILGAITTPGIIANVFALVLTSKILRHQKIVCNVLIFGLTCCDLFGIILICTPTWLCYAYGKWTGGKSMCYFQGFFTVFTSHTSGLIATCMALDRYLAVRAPFFHRQRISFRFAKKALVSIIIFSAVISLMPVFGFGSFELNLTQTYCTLNWFAETQTDKAYAYFFAASGFLLIVIVLFTNMHVLFLILKRKNSARNLKGLRSKFKKVNETKKTASEKIQQQYQRMMVIISILFLICWTPFMIRIICNVSGVWENKSADLQVSRLLLLNPVLDPFIYVLTRKQYRDTFVRLFCFCCPCGKKKRKESIKVRFAYSASIKTNDSNQTTDQSQLPEGKPPVLKPREERASIQGISCMPNKVPVTVQSTDALVHVDSEENQSQTPPEVKVNGELKENDKDSLQEKADQHGLVNMETAAADTKQPLRDKHGILPTITENDVREALRDLAKEPGFANEGMTDEIDDVLFSEIMETLKNCFAGLKAPHGIRKTTGDSDPTCNDNDDELLISIDSHNNQATGGETSNGGSRINPTVSMKALQVMDIIQRKKRAKQIEKMV